MQKTIYYGELLLATARSATKTSVVATFMGQFSMLKRMVMDKSRFLLIILGVTLLAACGKNGNSNGETDPGVPPPTNNISGTVLFKGSPLAGVTITVFNTNSDPSNIFAVTTTDANGNYNVQNVPTGGGYSGDYVRNYQVLASKMGYAFTPFMASNPLGDRTDYLWNPLPHDWYVETGAIAIRQGYNGSFSNQNGGAGIMFNVISFNSITNNSITGADFNAYNGSNPLVSLAATGQRTSYVSGDDASEQKGVAWSGTRYVDNSNGTVTDNLTGLIWLKNAGCFTPMLWASALADVNQLASGTCGLTDGSTAGQWRLPNIIELESMVDDSVSNPAVNAGSPFTNVSSGIYWSSTPYYGGELGSSVAWAIRFSDGRYMNDSVSNVMATSSNAVWAVRGAGGGAVRLQATGAYVPSGSGDDGSVESGVQLTSPRMFDNGNGTVTDTVTGLIWMKQADCINDTWSGSIAKVNSLANGQCGLIDGSTAGSWRMPNRLEMLSIADRAQNNQAEFFNETFVSGTVGVSSQAAFFTNFVGYQYYWTSTTNAANIIEAWTVFSCDFGVYDIAKSSIGYTLAVR